VKAMGANRQRVRIGCCGFPVARAKYYEMFDVVEVQQTFYEPPRVETVRRWREEAPAGFEFSLKAWQLITHEARSPTYRRLKTHLGHKERAEAGAFRWSGVVRMAWDRTREVAQALGARMIVFQCPASFAPTAENKDRVRRFFQNVDRRGLVCIWEPRGKWRPAEIKALCDELDLVHCVDPFTAETTTTGLRYWRLHGIGGYRHRYSDQELQDLRAKASGRRQTWCLFNNLGMWEDARRFATLFKR